MAPRVVLKLYVTGQTARTERAISNLRRICDQSLGNQYQLFVIDVLEQPHVAEAERIVATPTLVRELPLPARRIIGDLSDSSAVLRGLDISPAEDGDSREGAL